MANNIEQAVKPLEDKLQAALAEVKKLKTAINTYYEAMGEPLKYPDIGQESVQGAAPRPDEYYGRPLATVITEVLQKRKQANLGSAPLDTIFNELVAGACKLQGKDAGIQKRNLAISLSKNPKFHRLDNNTWGLREWYPDVKESKDITGSVNKQAKEARDTDEVVSEILNDVEKDKNDDANKGL